MNAGPPEQSPGEVPPPPPAEAAPPSPDAPAPYPYAPPPGGPPVAARPPRSMGPLIAVIGVVIIVVVAVLGYAIAGYSYSQGRLNSATKAYNAVVDRENKYNDTINSVSNKLVNVDVSATTADLQSNKALLSQATTSSQQAQTQIDADDSSLIKADSDLMQNQWLTAINKSQIDRESTKIGHLRKALAAVKVITVDYVQFGTFYQTYYDVLLDFDALATQEQATSATGVIAALAKVKTDSAKAISLDKAPGVPAEIDTFLRDGQTAANDLTALFDAIGRGDTAAENAANAAVQKDITKLNSDDLSKVGDEVSAFYKPLIDDYNSEVDKANST